MQINDSQQFAASPESKGMLGCARDGRQLPSHSFSPGLGYRRNSGRIDNGKTPIAPVMEQLPGLPHAQKLQFFPRLMPNPRFTHRQTQSHRNIEPVSPGSGRVGAGLAPAATTASWLGRIDIYTFRLCG
jgi:hypothetical protein